MDKLQYLVKTFSRTTKKDYENYVVNAIYQRVGNLNLQPVTQQYVRRENGYAKIDLYFPQIKVAVEVDEQYHTKEEQVERDLERELEIRQQIESNPELAASVVTEKVEFQRVKIPINDNNMVDEGVNNVESQINEIVKFIKEKITALEDETSEYLHWDIEGSNAIIENIKKTKKLYVGVGFGTMREILSAFGKEVKNIQTCYAYSDSYREEVWSPTLSVDLGNGIKTNNNGWQNELVYDNQGISEIVETYVDDNSEIKQQRSIKFEGEKSVQLARFIFAHSKDALGVFERKFIGVFIPSYMKGDSIHYKRVEGLYDDRGEEYFDISNITFNKLNKTIKYTEIQKTKKIVSSSGKFNSPYTTYNQDSTKDMFNIYEEPENVEDYMIIKVRDEVVKERDSRYEATRYAWKISLEQAQKRSYVLSVTDGIVKAIYKVIKWEYVTKYNYIYERDIGRVMFTGIEVTDKSICDRFLNKMIPEKYRRKGMASPCLYCKK